MNRILSMATLVISMVVSVSASTINIPADYPTIQEGFDASDDGDTVIVAQGIYYENLILEKEIVFASHAIYDDLGSDWLNNENITGTIISGAQEPSDPNKGSCLIVRGGYVNYGGNPEPTIMGLTFQDGDGTSMITPSCDLVPQGIRVRSGGGILMYKAYPTIMYNRFINNGHDNDNLRAGRGGRIGGAMGHFANDDIEFDEDRSLSSHNNNQKNNSNRDIPETLNIQNNYFENNASGDGANFYSHGYEGSIDVSNSIFEDIDCETNSVNEFVLRSIENEADYLQNDISGNCIESISFYVSSTGNDINDGTESAPFKTIGRALTFVKPNIGVAGETITTINLSSGTYSPTITGEKFPIVLPDNVHLIGEERETTILDAEADEENQAAVMIIKEVENVRVANLTLTGGSSESHGCIGGGGLLITADDMLNFVGPTNITDVEIENVIIRNNESFRGGGLSLVRVSGFGLNNIIIDQNATTESPTYENDGGGIYAAESSGLMTNVSITANTAYHAGTAAYIEYSDITMKNCNIVDNIDSGSFSTIVVEGGSLHLINSNIVNNTVLFGSGIMSCNNGNFNIVNSIIYDNCSTYVDGDGNWDCDEPYGPSNVLIWPGGQGYEPGTGEISYSDVLGGWAAGEGNIDADPRFISAGTGDYTLSENSPCIDAGTADINGDGFPDVPDSDYFGSAPDMGAFEYVESGGPTEIMVSYNLGWNIVGLSVEVDDNSYETLFPNAQSGSLYTFDGIYQEQGSLEPGVGYLLRMNIEDNVSFTGFPINELTINLSEGWNLFSGLSSSISSDIVYGNDIVQGGTIYGLDVVYYNAETIEPGMGYWVRTTEDGEITINSDLSAKQGMFVNRMDDANLISFTNENYSTNLYFGVEVPEDEILSYSLPPTLPDMAFDVRFSGDMKLVPESGEIVVSNHSEMLTIEYDIKIYVGEHMNWVLTSESGKDYTLEGTGEITISSEERFVLNKETVVPSIFTLHQNFPNPFNPITTLMYDLPSDAFVTLSIYDMLGGEITQLVNTTQQAGFKSIQWDATDSMGRPVSAGVYIYQIQAGEFIQTRKMVLLK